MVRPPRRLLAAVCSTDPRDDAAQEPFHGAGIVAGVAVAIGIVQLHGGMLAQTVGETMIGGDA